MGRWEPNRAEIQRAVSDPARALVSRATRQTLNLAKARAPRDTGRLANSLGMRVREAPNSVRGFVSTRVKYAMPIHEGARAHVIRPRRSGGRLRFFWEAAGREVSFRYVNHPGVGSTPFLTSSMAQVCAPMGFTIIRTLSPSLTDPNL